MITTLWMVHDRASYELMREIYTKLETMKKAEALRQAQWKMVKELPQPFFWAAFQLTREREFQVRLTNWFEGDWEGIRQLS